MKAPHRVAVVAANFDSPAYAKDERAVAALAHCLASSALVTILTSCGEHAPGYSVAGGIQVRRFRRSKRPAADELQAHVEQFADYYDAFVFVDYDAETTYRLLPKVREKAALFPLTAGVEPHRLAVSGRVLALAKELIFASAAERRLVHTVFPGLSDMTFVFDAPVSAPAGANPARFRERFRIYERFLLCTSRLDVAEGCAELIHEFLRRSEYDGRLRKLVLAGDLAMQLPEVPGIVYVGRLDDESKWDALAACQLAVSPTHQESLPLPILEAWAMSKPVVCSAHSETARELCRRGQGGLWYGDGTELGVALDLLANDFVAHSLGAQGRAYVERRHDMRPVSVSLLELLTT